MTKRTRWIIGLVVLVAIWMGPGIVELARLSLRQHQLDRQLESLQRERERLLIQQARLRHDAIYVEGLIRSTFKHARVGEYVIPMDSAASR